MNVNYGAGVAQDALKVVAGWISRNKDINVVYHNGSTVCANVDTGTVYIPRASCVSGLDYETLMLLRSRVYHEAGHLAETKLPKSMMPTDKVLFDILNALEDVRMEKVCAADHAGCREVFSWAGAWHNREIAKGITGGGANPVWEVLAACMFRAQSIRPAWILSPKAQEYMDLIGDEFMKVHACASTKDCLPVAKRIYELLIEKNEQDKEDEEPEDGQGKGDGKDDGKGKQDGGQGDGKGDEQGKDEQGKDDATGDGNGNSVQVAVDDGDSGEVTDEDGAAAGELVEDEEVIDVLKILAEEAAGVSMDELANAMLAQQLENVDATYTSLRDNDAHITVPVTDGGIEMYKALHEKVAAKVATLAHTMEQSLRSMARCRKISCLQHGKLDQRRLVQIATGVSKEVFYNTRRGNELNVACILVIDESASMRRALNQSRLLTLATCEALNSVGIPFEVVGTTTKYCGGDVEIRDNCGFTRTNPIEYRHYKDFNENWTAVRSRITALSHREHNIDGEVLEYAAWRLAGRKESRKVIFSVNDGDPESGQGQNSLLGKNIQDVCLRCRKSGIEVYGFGIDTDEPAQFYGKEYYAKMHGSEMSDEFLRNLARIITQGVLRL
jgi:cobalamin biosynthesis protein CobT